MTQPQPTTLALDDATSDALGQISTTIDEIEATLERIARAVETVASTGSG